MRRDCGAFTIGPVFGGTSGVAASPEASHVAQRYAPFVEAWRSGRIVIAPKPPLSWDEKVARWLQSNRA